MFNLKNTIRPNIQALQPYSSARDEFKGTEGVFLDANENPFGTLNRYPDAYQKKLKQKVSEVKNVPVVNIFTGNGSDEIIDLCYRIFCEPNSDKALIFTPTYGMYQVSAAINNVELIQIPLNSDFQISKEQSLPFLKTPNLKLIFLCSPNNPTGNLVHEVEWVLQNTEAIVVVDEAYIDFADAESLSRKITQYPNLIVLQTLSKAWGLAAARIGIAFADENIIQILNKVKPPYNISTANQQMATSALAEIENFKNHKELILTERLRLQDFLTDLPCVEKVFPSDANFLLIKVINPNLIYNFLADKGIIIRNRNAIIADCLRITIGKPEENNALIEALKNIEL